MLDKDLYVQTSIAKPDVIIPVNEWTPDWEATGMTHRLAGKTSGEAPITT